LLHIEIFFEVITYKKKGLKLQHEKQILCFRFDDENRRTIGNMNEHKANFYNSYNVKKDVLSTMYRPAVLETCIGGNCAGNGS
jgi:hypothetical protein